jgi:hypothetical protein
MESNSQPTAGPVDMADKPKPKDFSHYYSVTTTHRVPSKMKEYYKFFRIPGVGNLAGGKHPVVLKRQSPWTVDPLTVGLSVPRPISVSFPQ